MRLRQLADLRGRLVIKMGGVFKGDNTLMQTIDKKLIN